MQDQLFNKFKVKLMCSSFNTIGVLTSSAGGPAEGVVLCIKWVPEVDEEPGNGHAAVDCQQHLGDDHANPNALHGGLLLIIIDYSLTVLSLRNYTAITERRE